MTLRGGGGGALPQIASDIEKAHNINRKVTDHALRAVKRQRRNDTVGPLAETLKLTGHAL